MNEKVVFLNKKDTWTQASFSKTELQEKQLQISWFDLNLRAGHSQLCFL